ncbi:Basic fibroblast growth factor receptor 1 A [Fasciola gigantica]|uniref:Basic fibroblast growth factor receptor 1 A n=1 Tax=Fasciola gigantica TaxID=46835 RepID=A0A504YB19_FASGI|nr:Basic fibroblast growth factor receptor 1 A [Fasciola gigantica]
MPESVCQCIVYASDPFLLLLSTDVTSVVCFVRMGRISPQPLTVSKTYLLFLIVHLYCHYNFQRFSEIADSNHESFVFPELGIEDYPIIDELRNLKKSDPDHKHSSNQTADTELSHDMVETHSRREESLPVQSIPRLETPTRPPSSSSSSSTPKQTKQSYFSTQIPDVTVSAFDPALDVHEGSSDLNCSTLTPSTHPRLDFFVHHSKACIGANQTVDCRFFRIPIQLELWFLRPLQEDTLTPQSCTEECNNLGCFERPQLLKKSHVQEYRFIRQPSRHIERSYQFDDSVAVTLISLGPEHSGLYLCKAGHIYRALTVEVRDCSASNLNFRPLILIILLLFTTAAMLSVPLVVCLRARRKPVIAVLSSSMFNLNSLPGLGTKKQTMISRWNKLYPPINETTTHALLLGSAAKSWLLPTKQKQQPIIVPLKSHIKRLRRKQSRVYRPASRLVPLNPRWEVDRAQIEIGCVLGQGNFGIVYSGVVRGVLPGSRCSRKSSPARSGSKGLKQEVAIKTLKDDYTQEQLMDLLRELETMRLLDSHPHLIQLLGACTQQGTPMILMEFAEHGNLRDYLRENRPTLYDEIEPCILDNDAHSSTTQSLGHELNIPMLLRFACHVADALTYFESLKMVHRDVAARNVLICAGYIAKLSDFGFSRVIENDYYIDINRDQVPYKWMAPECYETHRCTLKSDVWSFGILLWEMFSLGEVPYPGVSTADLPKWLAAGNRNTQPLLADVKIFNLMLRCWETEPDKRPGFQTILKELSCHWLGNPPRPQRQLSQDSGCCSESQSGQSSSLKDFIFTDVLNTSAPVSLTEPVPPVRTCSLPHGGKPSTVCA